MNNIRNFAISMVCLAGMIAPVAASAQTHPVPRHTVANVRVDPPDARHRLSLTESGDPHESGAVQSAREAAAHRKLVHAGKAPTSVLLCPPAALGYD
jgi:hypothetical protein